jgi:NADH-quinone oxidoreductase subunit G
MMIKIQIDGKYYEVNPGKNLLETCLALGINVPHFCYHAAMGSVGACRLCAVKKYRDATDMKGRIIMSCMEPVVEGLIVSVEDPDTVAFRTAILESLMINHPHDCPVCDEGGECHLQDMVVMTGHTYRRNEFPKRTYTNQYLGPFINHEMNRCIQCYRCVRFYNDYAGGKDLSVFGAHDNVYFGRHEPGVLENVFSGNLVEVCPTGVFTDKTLKEHYTRKWDLTNAPSICTHCSLGCNIIAGERYGSVRRIMSRYNGAVNGYFICDRGRFGYEFVNDEKRPRKAQIRLSKDKTLEEASPEIIQSALSAAISGSKKVIGIGSPRASLEANFALSTLVGKENFFHGVSGKEQALVNTVMQILQKGSAHSPSLKEIEKADAVLILGEDITNTAPMAALAVRQAARTIPIEAGVKAGIPAWNDAAQRELAQDLKTPVFIAYPFHTELDDMAEDIFRASFEDIANLGFAIASAFHDSAPALKFMSDEMLKMAQKIYNILLEAKNPLIITGTHCGSQDILHAASNIAEALTLTGKKVSLSFLLPDCNSMGLAMMEGKSLDDAAEVVRNGGAETMIILENDLYRRADKEVLDPVFANCKTVIVLDHLMNETSSKADILLPVGTFAEAEGTLVNNEGRAQRYYRVLPLEKSEPESWRQLRDIMKIAGKPEGTAWKDFDDVVTSMTEFPVFAKLKGHMPDADFRMINEKIKRQTIRFSGRTAMNAKINVSEPKPPQDPDSPLAFSMEGSDERPPSSLVPYYWTPGWNSVQSMNFYLDEPNGSLKGGDPGIRLIETSENPSLSFFIPGQISFTQKKDEWLIVPVYQIFGSEPLSASSPAIKERISSPFILLNKQDVEMTGKNEGDEVKIEVSHKTLIVKVKIDNTIPSGIAGLAFGLPGMAFVDLPSWGKFIELKK